MRGFFASLEAMNSPAAVLAEWRDAMDVEFTLGRSLLRPTQRRAETFPCPQRPPCGCRHEVMDVEGVGFRAVCRCDFGDCPTAGLAPLDVVVHELDTARMCGALRNAFGFDGLAPGPLPGAPRSWHVGTSGPCQRPVVLSITSDEIVLLAEVGSVCALVPEPFLLLTPAGVHFTPRVDAAVRRHHALHLPLARFLAPGGASRFKRTQTPEPVLAEWERRLAGTDQLALTVDRIDRHIEAVAKGQYELRRENEELMRLIAAGHLKFAVQVDKEDFIALAYIMALGNRKAAADRLGIPHRSFYDRVGRWRRKGDAYQRMHRMVEWRRRVGRSIKVRLNESLQSGEAGDHPENPETLAAVLDHVVQEGTGSREDMLRDILGALQNQNADNWPEVREELISILREELPQ